MKINILITHRPLPFLNIYQLKDKKWGNDSKGYKYGFRWGVDEDELIRAIKFLNKNSYFKHPITVIIDSDVFPDIDYLKEFDNVKIIKSGYAHNGPIQTLKVSLQNAADIEGINSIPDEEWLCYAYQSDLICSKDWDKHIIEAIEEYGEQYVYVPMFTEIRGGMNNISVAGLDPTPDKIWDEWRKTISCHSLTMPYPKGISTKNGFVTEDDMDYFIKRSNEANKPSIIVEKPGDRVYGYYAILIMKAKFAKKAIRLIGPGFDTDFDNRLYTECNLMKAVVTKSFIFHPFCKISPLK